MGAQKNRVSRTQVGLVALTCFVGAVGFWLWGANKPQALASSFLRVGIVMSALWLAMPTRNREAAWANISPFTLGGIILIVLVLKRVPTKIFLPLIVLLVLSGLLLRPRPKHRRPQGPKS